MQTLFAFLFLESDLLIHWGWDPDHSNSSEHVLELGPSNSNPGLHEKVQVTPHSVVPWSQFILPLRGALIVEHLETVARQNKS